MTKFMDQDSSQNFLVLPVTYMFEFRDYYLFKKW